MNELGDFAVPDRAFPLVRVLLVTLGTLFAVLVATGVWLLFEYQPASERSWAIDAAHEIHHITALLFIVALVAALGVLGWRARERRGAVGTALGVAAFVLGAFVAVLANRSGRLLAWDQLALWAVRLRGDDIRGVVDIPATVRFVIVDGNEITPSTFSALMVLHAAVLPSVAVAMVVALTVFSRRRRERAPDMEPLPVS
jgi:quinol-cytochrome oxidoreductase complex cytochrome b subunit